MQCCTLESMGEVPGVPDPSPGLLAMAWYVGLMPMPKYLGGSRKFPDDVVGSTRVEILNSIALTFVLKGIIVIFVEFILQILGCIDDLQPARDLMNTFNKQSDGLIPHWEQ